VRGGAGVTPALSVAINVHHSLALVSNPLSPIPHYTRGLRHGRRVITRWRAVLRRAQHEAAGVDEHGKERALEAEGVRRLHALDVVVVVVGHRGVHVHVEPVQSHPLAQLQR
jgi:hypothetical protein